MHVVPLAYLRQLPPPSQEPSVPQVAEPASVHWLSGSWPAGTEMQVPSEPANLVRWVDLIAGQLGVPAGEITPWNDAGRGAEPGAAPDPAGR